MSANDCIRPWCGRGALLIRIPVGRLPERFPGQVREIAKAGHEIASHGMRVAGWNLPVAGGGYFRALPYGVTRRGLRSANREHGQPFVFYLHPWEIDPGQPRVPGLPPAVARTPLSRSRRDRAAPWPFA